MTDKTDEKKVDGRKNNKGNLKNLKIIDSPEMAREYQRRATEAQRENRAKLEIVKIQVEAIKKLALEAPTALETLKAQLVEATLAGDNEMVVKISAILAEYQESKLSRQEITQKNIDVSEVSDEELEKLAQDAGIDLKIVGKNS